MLQYFEIPSIDATVRKNIIDAIVEKVLINSGVKESELLYLDEDINTSRQPGTQLGEVSNFSYGQGERTLVEVTEEPDEMERVVRGVGLNRQVPFFHDKKFNVRVAPIMRRHDVEVTITRNSPSKEKLQRWCNRINSLIDMGQYTLITDAEFFYIIPTEALALLKDCHTALSQRLDNPPTLGDYLKDGFLAAVTKTTNVAGSKASLAVRHTATRIEVIYDLDGPKKEKQEVGYSAVLRINFSYEKPMEVCARHPVALNQSMIDSKWLPTFEPPYLSNEVGVSKSDIQHALDYVANYYHNTLKLPWLLTGEENYLAIQVPNRDSTTVIFGSDIIFGEDNMFKPDVVGLVDLPFELNQAILDYIFDCIAKDPHGKNCIFQIRFYKDGIPFPLEAGSWDSEGYWTFDGDIELSSNYYYTITFLNNWRYLDTDMLHILRHHPKVVKIIFEWWFKNKVLEIDVDKRVSWPLMEKVITAMTRNVGDSITTPITVLNSTIITFRPGVK